MAKHPDSGLVKTRLLRQGLDSSLIRQLAWELLRCTLSRVSRIRPVIVAVTPDQCVQELKQRLECDHDELDNVKHNVIDVVAQGSGNLGEKLDRVWMNTHSDSPICFFGTDCPDVSDPAINSILPALETHDVVLGPVEDGGIWALAARRYIPEILLDINWGTDEVFSQLSRRAQACGASVKTLESWYDIDRPADVFKLRDRMQTLESGLDGNEKYADPQALTALYNCVSTLCESMAGTDQLE